MPFVPFNIGRLPYGSNIDPDRLRQMADFINAMIDVNGDFLLGDITIGRGGGRIYTNAAFGRNVLLLNTSGTDNFGAGNDVLTANTIGLGNTGSGSNSLLSNTSGSYNTASGFNALYSNLNNDFNCAFGYSALYSNVNGRSNCGIGYNSLFSNVGGDRNIGIGESALYYNADGNLNVAIGNGAAQRHANGTTQLTTTNNSVYIGASCRGYNDSDSNSIVIGYQAIGEGANTTVIGNSSTTAAHIYGAVTVGGLVIDDAKNIVLNTTTGTKIGTATSQKLGLWNATPVVQPTTAVTAAAFTANSSGIADDTATFGGYTIGQIVAALKAIGALA